MEGIFHGVVRKGGRQSSQGVREREERKGRRGRGDKSALRDEGWQGNGDR